MIKGEVDRFGFHYNLAFIVSHSILALALYYTKINKQTKKKKRRLERRFSIQKF